MSLLVILNDAKGTSILQPTAAPGEPVLSLLD